MTMSLFNKRIIIGVSGGIAAYKSAELVRELKKAGAEVRVVMTRAAKQFIGPLTLQALSGHPVHDDVLSTQAEAAMGHIDLARWADLVVIAPATADSLARLAQGRADDLLASLCLATAAPVAVAPAMNQQMWQAAATQQNLQLLAQRQVVIWGPASGEQACGEVGPGRMLEPVDIVSAAAQLFETGLLAGKRVVITAGPTREALDPVRYISNRSSGKMGYALAQAAVEAGAVVTLVSGPVTLTAPEGVQFVKVETAAEMSAAALSAAERADIVIAAAAVADYTPAKVADVKTAKQDTLTLELQRTEDIVATLAQKTQAFVVGFAAETDDLISKAKAKLERKQLDMIVANQVGGSEGGFDSDDNAAIVLWSDGERDFSLMSKSRLAREIIQLVVERYATSNSTKDT